MRERLERWAGPAVAELAEARPMLPPELSDRAADVWEPLLAIADMAGGKWPERARQAALTLANQTSDNSLSLGSQLLTDIAEVLDGRTGNITSAELIEALVSKEEAPWGALRGRPLDPRALAGLLKGYGVKPHTVRIESGTAKGYTISDFLDPFSRYLRIPGNSVTSVTSVTKSAPEAAAERNETDSKPQDVTGVTVKKDIHKEGASGGVLEEVTQ